MTLNEAVAEAERLEAQDCIGTTSQALRTLLRAYNDLLEEYRTYEESVRNLGWEKN